MGAGEEDQSVPRGFALRLVQHLRQQRRSQHAGCGRLRYRETLLGLRRKND